MKHKINKVLSILLALALVLGLAPAVSIPARAAQAQDPVPYLDETGAEKECTNYTVIDESTTDWQTGWYVLSSSVEISDRITVTGSVHLILVDGCTLDAQDGVQVAEGNSLTIYGQSEGTEAGKLNATANNGDAAIGGNNGGNGSNGGKGGKGGNITINGGTVTATANRRGTAIGGGRGGDGYGGNSGSAGGDGGTLTINGGTVTATSDDTAIGGGRGGDGGNGGAGGDGGNITINGGTVTARSYGTAIGGGNGGAGGDGGNGGNGGAGGDGGNITINGGTATANGSHTAIGGGRGGRGGRGGNGGNGGAGGDGGTLTINGGTVTARSYGTAIGGGGGDDGGNGGNGGNGGTVTINGGTVTATTDRYVTAIGGGMGGDGHGGNGGAGGDGGTLTINGGTVTATSYGTAIGGGGGGDGGADGAGGTVKLGWTAATDSITVSKWAQDVQVTLDKNFKYEDSGEKVLRDDFTGGKANGRKLVPFALKAIELGAGGIKQHDTVYMGTYKADDETIPVPWFMLDTDGFMLSRYRIGTSAFRENYGYYNGSVLQGTMNGLYNGQGKTLFQSLEQGAIKETTLEKSSMHTDASDVSAHLFPLSYGEAEDIGWENDLLKARSINDPEGFAGLWWLRSSGNSGNAYWVYADGSCGNSVIYGGLGVRPALNLNLESVLFTSSPDGKEDGASGLAEIRDYAGSEWKLTLHDSERDGFEVIEKTAEMAPGGTVELCYNGATVKTTKAPNEYVSVILTDTSGNPLYYGRLAQPINASGTAAVTLPTDLAEGAYILRLFSEQYNGEKKTDYASAFQDVELTVKAGVIDNQKELQLGTAALRTSANTANARLVSFAGQNWYVIAYDGKNGNGNVIQYTPDETVAPETLYPTGAATLLSKDALTYGAYKKDWSGKSYYIDSDLRQKIDEAFSEHFSDEEKTAVLERTLIGGGEALDSENYDSNKISGDNVEAALWPLSTAEAHSLSHPIRKSFFYDWWLRTPGININSVAFVQGADDGAVNNIGEQVWNGPFNDMRAAFYLDLPAVLFTSAAEGGKAGTLGTLSQIGDYTGNEWKLTLKDTANRRDFQAVVTAVDGEKLTVTWDWAQTGENEYLSAVIKDNASGALTHYGRLKKLENESDKNGTREIDLSGIDMTGKTLCVFNEQYNGEKKTDYASELVELPTDAPNAYPVELSVRGFTVLSYWNYVRPNSEVTRVYLKPNPGYYFNDTDHHKLQVEIGDKVYGKEALNMRMFYPDQGVVEVKDPAKQGSGFSGKVKITYTTEPIPYEIKYELDGGTNNENNPKTYTVEDTITLADPEWRGYTFDGWYETADFSGSPVTGIPANSTGDKTFYAKWTPDIYNISYQNLKGASNSNPKTYTIVDTPLTLAALTGGPTGYAFDGWYDNPAFIGNAVTVIPLNSTGDKTFYAKWTPIPYNINYELDGGTNNENNPKTYTVEDTITLADPEWTGHTFDGWYDNAGFSGDAVTGIPANSTGDKTFYAKWEAHTYTVSYDANANGEVDNPPNQTKTHGITLRLHTSLIWKDHVFIEWTTEQNGGGKAYAPDSDYTDEAPLTLYAKWADDLNGNGNPDEDDDKFTVTYKDGLGGAVFSDEIHENCLVGLPPPAFTGSTERTGYTFEGWNPTLAETVKEDVTYTAKWKAIEYDITYNNLNGATNSNPKTYTIVDTPLTLAALTGGPTGYAFDGWYDNAAFIGNAVTVIPLNSTGDKTFYAKWTANKYTVTFDANGHGTAPAAQTVEYGKTATKPADPTASGWKFEGWYKEAECTDAFDFSAPITGNITLFAKWTKDGGKYGDDDNFIAQYTLKYETNGGSSVDASRHSRGATVELTVTPTREGYTFTGWYADAALTEKITSVKMDGSKTVYAGWQENSPAVPVHDCPSAQLKDVDANAWYHEYVDYVVENGLMQGVAEDRFAPNLTTTRAMIVTILYRLEGKPAVSGTSPFVDVAAGQWYADAVIWANANGIVEGYGNGRFGPNDLITREQLAAILYRYAKFKGYDVSVGQDTNILSYDDAFEVSDWAMEAMQWAVGSGLITGRTETMLVPRGEATRAEAAAILMRFIEK